MTSIELTQKEWRHLACKQPLRSIHIKHRAGLPILSTRQPSPFETLSLSVSLFLYLYSMADQLLSAVARHETLPATYVRPESQRPRLHEVVSDDNIPLINLDSGDCARQIGDACRDYGFFQVLPLLFRSLDFPISPLT